MPLFHDIIRVKHLSLNSLRPRQNGRHFADDIFKCIFFNENARISITISLNFVPKGPINNIPVLVQIMAWRQPGASHYLNRRWLVSWRIYASLGLNELNSLICTGWCRYNGANFLQNSLKGDTIARPLGRDMVCLLLIQSVIYIPTPITSVKYAMFCYIGPRYNDTHLYCQTVFNGIGVDTLNPFESVCPMLTMSQ